MRSTPLLLHQNSANHYTILSTSVNNDLYWKNPIVVGADRRNRLACGRDDAKVRCRLMRGAKRRQSAKLLPDEVHCRMLGVGYTLGAKRQHRMLACCCHTQVD
jgi:hypothetical protein